MLQLMSQQRVATIAQGFVLDIDESLSGGSRIPRAITYNLLQLRGNSFSPS